MKNTKTKLPKWFKEKGGEIYPNGEVVKNPFSGETYKLNSAELSMYDFIMGCTFLFEMQADKDGYISDECAVLQNDIRKVLDWFRKNNIKAYMVLLD